MVEVRDVEVVANERKMQGWVTLGPRETAWSSIEKGVIHVHHANSVYYIGGILL